MRGATWPAPLPASAFAHANMVQFSVDPGKDAQEADASAIANAMCGVTEPRQGRLPDLFHFAWHAERHYFQRHGAIAGYLEQDCQQCLRQAPQRDRDVRLFFRAIRPRAGGSQPHGVHPRRGPTAPSFGCGEQDHYTFFDDLLPAGAARQRQFSRPGGPRPATASANRKPRWGWIIPSEPQLNIGNAVMPLLAWRCSRQSDALASRPAEIFHEQIFGYHRQGDFRRALRRHQGLHHHGNGGGCSKWAAKCSTPPSARSKRKKEFRRGVLSAAGQT